jgi:hypothetical protein
MLACQPAFNALRLPPFPPPIPYKFAVDAVPEAARFLAGCALGPTI